MVRDPPGRARRRKPGRAVRRARSKSESRAHPAVTRAKSEPLRRPPQTRAVSGVRFGIRASGCKRPRPPGQPAAGGALRGSHRGRGPGLAGPGSDDSGSRRTFGRGCGCGCGCSTRISRARSRSPRHVLERATARAARPPDTPRAPAVAVGRGPGRLGASGVEVPHWQRRGWRAASGGGRHGGRAPGSDRGSAPAEIEPFRDHRAGRTQRLRRLGRPF